MLDLRTVQEDRERNRDREKANLQKCRDAKLWNLVCVRKEWIWSSGCSHHRDSI